MAHAPAHDATDRWWIEFQSDGLRGSEVDGSFFATYGDHRFHLDSWGVGKSAGPVSFFMPTGRTVFATEFSLGVGVRKLTIGDWQPGTGTITDRFTLRE